MKVKARAAACLSAAAMAMASAQSEDRASRDALLEALRRQRSEAETGRWAPGPALAGQTGAARRAQVAGEQPCWPIDRIVVRGLGAAERPLRQEFEAFPGGCLGAASLEALHHNLALRLAETGLITSRVTLAPEAPADGALEVHVIPGRVESLVAADGEVSRRWRHALAIDEGDVLDVFRLDAALDHFNRLGDERVAFRLEPGSEENATRVVLVRGAKANPRATLAADNDGAQEFGRAQLDLALRIDEPLGLMDQLRLSLGSNAAQGAATNRSVGVHYSLPWRLHRLSLTVQASWRQQPVRGTTVEFRSRGQDRTVEWRWDMAAWRSSDTRLGPWVAWRDRRSHQWLDGTELVVQRRHRATWEAGGQWWHQAASWRWSLEASHAEGRRRGAPNPFVPNDGVRTRTDRLQARLMIEPDAGAPGWQVEVMAQHGRQPGTGADLFAIGSSASVRGFGPEEALAAESGVLVRSELAWPLRTTDRLALQAYAGWDAGMVRGPTSVRLHGRRLAGLTAGVRLGRADALHADLSLAAPVHGPPESRASRVRPAIALHCAL